MIYVIEADTLSVWLTWAQVISICGEGLGFLLRSRILLVFGAALGVFAAIGLSDLTFALGEILACICLWRFCKKKPDF